MTPKGVTNDRKKKRKSACVSVNVSVNISVNVSTSVSIIVSGSLAPISFIYSFICVGCFVSLVGMEERRDSGGGWGKGDGSGHQT